jgi:hypothetical protein
MAALGVASLGHGTPALDLVHLVVERVRSDFDCAVVVHTGLSFSSNGHGIHLLGHWGFWGIAHSVCTRSSSSRGFTVGIRLEAI